MALTATPYDALEPLASLPDLPVFGTHTRLLVIAPHPDDETIANGVLIQRVRAAGGAVKILLLTDGENNPWPQRWLERRLRIGAAERRRWAQRRRRELEQALVELDVPSSALQTMQWPDMGVTDVLLHDGPSAVAELAAAIDAFGPDIVAMPAIDDRHPDHGSAHVLTRLALAQRRATPLQLAYLIHGRSAHASFVDATATPAQWDAKRRALDAHVSQMSLSSARLRRLATRTERHVRLAPSAAPRRESLPWCPPTALKPLLRLSVTDGVSVQTWPWEQAPLQRTEQGLYRLALPAPDVRMPRFARLACSLPSWWIFDRWGWCEC